MPQSVGEVALDIVAGQNNVASVVRNSMNDCQDSVNRGSSGISSALGKIGGVATAIGKTALIGVGAVGTAVAGLAKQSVEVYADYEQLVGGVETLFKDSADTVIGYADIAYKTAGLSANDYMDTVTSFSASLLQSLGGDTAKASEMANMAIIDMSDNANKMGTSMDMIQNAYQGFAKQNYTMLDNLKLGYGGTQAEMYRLMQDAEKLGAVFNSEYSLSSKGTLEADFADIVTAIHTVQTEMDITGTTSKEASSTISGSISSMKASWTNLLTGMGDDTQDFGKLIDNFVESVATVGDNLLPRISIVLDGVVSLISNLAPKIIAKIPEIVGVILPSIIDSSRAITGAIINVLPQLFTTIIGVLPSLVNNLVSNLGTFFTQNLPIIFQKGAEMLNGLASGLSQNIPTLLANVLPMIEQFTATIGDNIGLVVDAGLNLIMQLGQGIINSIPVLIEYVPQIVINICDVINENAPKLLITAGTLIWNLIAGIIQSIPTLIANVPKIIEAIVSVITAFNWLNLGSSIVKGIANGIKNLPATLKQFASNAVNGIKSAFTGGGIGNVVRTVFNGVKTSISTVMNSAKSVVSTAISKIKGFFKFSWSLPKLKLPHPTISGKFSLNPPSVPKFSISWYAKAMDKGMILNTPTIFGMGKNGDLLGGGEAGSETVVGTNSLLNMIRSAVSSAMTFARMRIEAPALNNVKAGNAPAENSDSKIDELIEIIKKLLDKDDDPIPIPIYIGNELIDEYILNKNSRQTIRSGGYA